MPWPEVRVESWQHFTTLAAEVGPNDLGQARYLLRGQAHTAWRLVPSLIRLFPTHVTAEQALAVESAALTDFTSQAHLHLPSAVLPPVLPKPSSMEWWALMQHHSAPTRLLDWTHSAYVAAYNSVEQQVDRAGAVYVVAPGPISTTLQSTYPLGLSNEQLGDPDAAPAIVFWQPRRKSDRFVAQQGHFSASAHILGDQDNLITTACARANDDHPNKMFYQRWIIPAAMKLDFLRKLRAMNIAAHSLFPGIDGLGRSLAERSRLATPAQE